MADVAYPAQLAEWKALVGEPTPEARAWAERVLADDAGQRAS